MNDKINKNFFEIQKSFERYEKERELFERYKKEDLLINWNYLIKYILDNGIISSKDIKLNKNREFFVDDKRFTPNLFLPYEKYEINSNDDLINFLKELEKLGVPLEKSTNIFLGKEQ